MANPNTPNQSAGADAQPVSVPLTFIGDAPAANQPVVMFSTAPDILMAKHIAHYLVEEGLAACVNLSAESLSMYMWKGVLEGETEISLTIKTTGARVHDVANRLCELHMYDVPELLIMPVQGGSKAYVDWLVQNTTSNR